MLATVPGVTVLVHDQAAPPRTAARPQPRPAGQARTSGSSSTSGCARAAATAATRATACRCSRSTRRTGARRASTRRAATSTCRACRATARRSPPSPSTTTGRNRGQAETPADARRSRRRAARPRARWCRRDAFTVRLSGIGGTGVITVSQILGTAAMLDGLRRARPRPDRAVAEGRAGGERRPRLSRERGAGVEPRQLGRASTACSPSTCSSPPATPTATAPTRRPHRSWSGRSRRHRPARWSPTRRRAYPELDALTGRLDEVSRAELNRYVDAAAHRHRAVRRRHDGQHPAARRRRAGRRRRRPSRRPSSGRSSSTASPSKRNVAAFRWGRRWVVAPARGRGGGGPAPTPRARDRRRADRPPRGRPRRLPVGGLRRPLPRARRAWPARPSSASTRRATLFTEAVARNLHKLMAYKDEYEVARLLLRARGARRRTRRSVGRGTKVTWRLHPPMLRALGLQAQDEARAEDDADVPGAAPRRSGCAARSPTRSVGPRCASSSGR